MDPGSSPQYYGTMHPVTGASSPSDPLPGQITTRKRRRRIDETRASVSATQHRACSACRLWKVRCDGDRPYCSSCVTRQVTCTYPSKDKRPRCTQAQVDALQDQIRILERQLSSKVLQESIAAAPSQRNHNWTQVTTRPTTAGVTSNFEGQVELIELAGGASDHNHLSDAHAKEPCQSQVGPQEVNHFNDAVESSPALLQHSPEENPGPVLVSDGMMVCGSTSLGDNVGSESFHESSSLTFARSLEAFEMKPRRASGFLRGRDDIEPSPPSCSVLSIPGDLVCDEESVVKAYLLSSSLNLLPAPQVARILFEQYMKSVHPITPYLLEEDVRRDFENAWSVLSPLKSSQIAQLNLIFALGCLFHDDDIEGKLPLENPPTAGEQFFQRAWGYIVANAFGTCTVTFLQLLLLSIQYQQGTNRANQCWLTVGHATKIAQCLGLYADPSLKQGENPLKVELYRRLWWGCYNLDR